MFFCTSTDMRESKQLLMSPGDTRKHEKLQGDDQTDLVSKTKSVFVGG